MAKIEIVRAVADAYLEGVKIMAEFNKYKVPFNITGYLLISEKSKGDAIEEVSGNYDAKDLVKYGYDLDVVLAPGYKEVSVVGQGNDIER